MPRPTLAELERLCQKPDHRRLGNWMARRVSRPAALRVTWIVSPWGVSANAATLAAWAAGVAAAVSLGWGSVGGWLLAAGLLQVWYLLDHVDGQLARLRGTASLDGVQLDYLMHHTVNLLVPMGAGWGAMAATAEPLWLVAGVAWGVATLLLCLHHDARYKAHMQRLKRLRGHLHVVGGGGATPQPQPPVPRNLPRLVAWVARKACEMHVVLNVVTLLAVAMGLVGDGSLLLARTYVAGMTLMAPTVAMWEIGRSQRRGAVEQEFALWYRVPPGQELGFSDGWWEVRPSPQPAGGFKQQQGAADGGDVVNAKNLNPPPG